LESVSCALARHNVLVFSYRLISYPCNAAESPVTAVAAAPRYAKRGAYLCHAGNAKQRYDITVGFLAEAFALLSSTWEERCADEASSATVARPNARLALLCTRLPFPTMWTMTTSPKRPLNGPSKNWRHKMMLLE